MTSIIVVVIVWYENVHFFHPGSEVFSHHCTTVDKWRSPHGYHEGANVLVRAVGLWKETAGVCSHCRPPGHHSECLYTARSQ